MYRFLAISYIVILSGIASSQSNDQFAARPTFHVQGTIDSMTNGAIPRVEVSFVGGNVSRTVVVDDKGFYQADLPVGAYTMTAAFPRSGLTKYTRFFRVPLPITVTLNGSLYATYSCDGVWAGEPTEEQFKDSSGGEDSFPFPSKDGVPLQLNIRYVRRERREKLLSYSSNGVVKRPVSVAYNLFALQADSVNYSPTDGIVRAYGQVMIEDQQGQTHASSAGYKFDDGKATRIW